MALTSMNDPVSIFNGGKLDPEIHNVRGIVDQTYIDIRDHGRGLCCRPVTLLEGKGLVCLCPSFGLKNRKLKPGIYQNPLKISSVKPSWRCKSQKHEVALPLARNGVIDRRRPTMLTLHADRTERIQAPSARGILRVVTVTSFTIVPKSSHSDSTRWVQVEDCPVASLSYGGGIPCTTGIKFHINNGTDSRPFSVQVTT